ncbi:hypothetical protein G3601_004059 [Salmonella enterica]|nr:hypothetical protein [Salmonella enterica]ECD6404001.1 hypothetical protein [Salmonella enterica subsp. enterica serovar Java]EDQ0183279.1 hypothetical protein [Salmonella enterica subsp. enterica serovar 4,[5],12:b:-]EAQ4528427.1 hypothetical protein [Salmonella enterica]EAS1292887.1 hypothetical protein [Salmonella enterica]
MNSGDRSPDFCVPAMPAENFDHGLVLPPFFVEKVIHTPVRLAGSFDISVISNDLPFISTMHSSASPHSSRDALCFVALKSAIFTPPVPYPIQPTRSHHLYQFRPDYRIRGI